VHFFPNQISDLSVVLGFVVSSESPVHDMDFWALRYVTLLWLSLIAKIPFDLAQFDTQLIGGDTMNSLETVAKDYLGYAGLEREAAALLLSTFFSRYV
jgi:tubulin-specific chaperone D